MKYLFTATIPARRQGGHQVNGYDPSVLDRAGPLSERILALERHIDQSDGKIREYLRIYEMELVGRVLVDRLNLPTSVIGGTFVFLYFGVLLVLHTIVGHPLPPDFKAVISHPSIYFYYPNLVGIAFDLIGNPLSFVFLTFFRRYIPRQFMQLEEDGLIKERHSLSRLARFVLFATCDRWAQVTAIIVIPVVASFSLTVLYVQVLQPTDIPWKYAVFLTLLGNYAKLAIIVQLAYMFLILSNYSLNMRLNLAHPNHCSGLAPFGNLAIAVYGFLFFWAMFYAIDISAGGGALAKTVMSISGPVAFLYLWVLFPLAILFIFDQFIYRPHRAMREFQRRHLEPSSRDWTSYHKDILSSLMTVIKTSEAPLASKTDYNFSDDLELLETWARLTKYVTTMHTWPISKSTFRIIATLVNPLIPILTPAIANFVRSLLP